MKHNVKACCMALVLLVIAWVTKSQRPSSVSYLLGKWMLNDAKWLSWVKHKARVTNKASSADSSIETTGKCSESRAKCDCEPTRTFQLAFHICVFPPTTDDNCTHKRVRRNAGISRDITFQAPKSSLSWNPSESNFKEPQRNKLPPQVTLPESRSTSQVQPEWTSMKILGHSEEKKYQIARRIHLIKS